MFERGGAPDMVVAAANIEKLPLCRRINPIIIKEFNENLSRESLLLKAHLETMPAGSVAMINLPTSTITRHKSTSNNSCSASNVDGKRLGVALIEFI
jgi:hypothetical protein